MDKPRYAVGCRVFDGGVVWAYYAEHVYAARTLLPLFTLRLPCLPCARCTRFSARATPPPPHLPFAPLPSRRTTDTALPLPLRYYGYAVLLHYLPTCCTKARYTIHLLFLALPEDNGSVGQALRRDAGADVAERRIVTCLQRGC